MTALWSWDALVAAANAAPDGVATRPVTGFSIDTRSIKPGDVFVALTDTRDGHAFVPAAFAAGAAAALVRRDYVRGADDGALLRVDAPLQALERIAVAARARLAADACVIAVTGSAGKTGTKEMLRACLAPLGPTHAPEKSFNNHWGVPLTLARMPADTRYAVIEIGMNHAGEIRPLTRMTRPHIAVITNVLPVHVGNFPDGEIGVANAKAEILEGVEPGGTAILNRDNPHFPRLEAAAQARQLAVMSFGRDPSAACRATAMTLTPTHTDVALDQVTFRLGVPGAHVAQNAIAVAAAVASATGRSGAALAATLAPLAGITAPAGRGARTLVRLDRGGKLLLIDESYNANPASVRAALATLADVPRDAFARRVVVLGDMRELGEHAADLHLSLRDAVDASGADVVFACGPFMRMLFDRLDASRQGAWAPTSGALAPVLAERLAAGDVVMIKGSLGTNMAPLVAAVRSLGRAGA